MPTNTYVELAKTTASGAADVTFDLTGISGYKDLVIIAQAKSSTSGSSVNSYRLRFNGLSTTLYSNTFVSANGSTAVSTRDTNGQEMYVGALNQASLNPELSTIHIMNYANTTTFKTVLARGNSASSVVNGTAGVWRSTAAITSIQLFMSAATLTGDFSLYGIKSVGGDTSVKATGGIITEDSTYYYHTFKGSSTFTPLQSLTADILVVAGGGGTMGAGGGGGGGGLLGFASQSLTAQQYSVIVGAGGSGGNPGTGTPTNGNNSKFGSLTTALGGAYGAGFTGAAYVNAGTGGGSGGGGAFNAIGQFSNGTAGQGNSGNNGYQDPGGGAPRSGGGGGGAGGSATNGGVGNTGGSGGIGATNGSTVGGSAGPYSFINAMGAASGTGQLSGGNYYYAGGGGGEGKNTRGAAGLGGGGIGGTSEPAQYPDSGIAFTGGGAGAGPNATSSYGGARGGSGIVIVRYTKA